MSQDIQGIAASDGIGIAPVYLLTPPDLSYQKRRIDDPVQEYQRVKQAFADSIEDLQQIKENAKQRLSDKELDVFDAHITILSDPEMLGQIQNEINDLRVNAEEAVSKVTGNFANMLAAMRDNKYMQERATDVRDIAQRTLSHLLGKKLPNLAAITEPVIVVAHELTPSDTSQMDPRLIKGIVTDTGGRTSHAAIMSRTLRIPAVVGTNVITEQVKNGQRMVVDGLSGHVIVDPSNTEINAYRQKAAGYSEQSAEWAQLVDAPSVSKDGKRFHITANIGTPDDVNDVIKQGAEGIGLFRSEFLYMGSDHLPTEDEQFEAYRRVIVNMQGKRVVVRTLDIGGDKPLPFLPLPREMNPFLGYRAIRICLDHPEIFKPQLRALIRASQYGPLSIMFPMIATIQELRKAKRIFNDCKQELQMKQPGIGDDIRLGMMIEIPLAAVNAEKMAREVDFFSIGTNDLIQYSFAADRGSDAVSYLYQPLNPAFLNLVRHIILAGHKYNIPVAMCGEMAGDKWALPLLMGMDLDNYSMSSSGVLRTRSMMKHLDTTECRHVVNDAITNCSTSQEVKSLVRNSLNIK
ncbi:phosphoenolpyruvate--protein phosphotransferase [Limosilactobacillus sp.]|jgi:phosphotransferase system enzyme I (PtsI)|uniref:phosphoenolpyruvate--protein phosphotransferase n=1 Tax=Limosilactobacillus sp. TaxID=2773925 RepID=UPI0025C2CD81|nr:phosphoenolpyruvate--protein phosphotransferase [Limosilactobacillus sp.]MCH3922203.1 phosphoenolpyruvate--protein phosphotransferase [Limosilactobacillus sp.]MCH3928974.1 phosphoenolpyruvate--protein phosphotransferase [Limosilactobacillus sp.]